MSFRPGSTRFMSPELGGADAPAVERYSPGSVRTTFRVYRDTPVQRQSVSDDRKGYDTQRNHFSHAALLRPAPDREMYLPFGATVLEVGPGIGNYTERMIESGHPVIALDLSGEQLQALRRNLEGPGFPREKLTTIEADVLDIPLPESSVDAAVCFGGPLSYVFDAAPQAVTEMLRVLRPGGALLVSVMTPGWIHSWKDSIVKQLGEDGFKEILRTGDVFHQKWLNRGGHLFRAYTPESLERLLTRCGATVVDMHASYAPGVPDEVPLDEYNRACRTPQAMEMTTGYLIAVARKPATP